MTTADKWCMGFSAAFILFVVGVYGYQALRPKEVKIGPEYGILIDPNEGLKAKEGEYEVYMQIGPRNYSEFVRHVGPNQVRIVSALAINLNQMIGFQTRRWELDHKKNAIRFFGPFS